MPHTTTRLAGDANTWLKRYACPFAAKTAIAATASSTRAPEIQSAAKTASHCCDHAKSRQKRQYRLPQTLKTAIAAKTAIHLGEQSTLRQKRQTSVTTGCLCSPLPRAGAGLVGGGHYSLPHIL